ncbi:hypothetical protein ACJX0J_017316, partial [Zea mays]
FNEVEIKNAMFQMEKNKAAGPDNIPMEFHQVCWDIIKGDIINLFQDLHNENLDATKIHQYRPICLPNCLYKLIAKLDFEKKIGFCQKWLSWMHAILLDRLLLYIYELIEICVIIGSSTIAEHYKNIHNVREN